MNSQFSTPHRSRNALEARWLAVFNASYHFVDYSGDGDRYSYSELSKPARLPSKLPDKTNLK